MLIEWNSGQIVGKNSNKKGKNFKKSSSLIFFNQPFSRIYYSVKSAICLSSNTLSSFVIK